MKKQKSIVIKALIVGGLVWALTNKNLKYRMDKSFLLENTHPGYYMFLSKPSIYYISKDTVSIPNNNLLFSDMKNMDMRQYGFNVNVQKDGSFTFVGKYNGGKPTYIYSVEIFNLETGEYVLSDGGKSIEGGIQMRLYGGKTCEDSSIKYDECVTLPGNGLFNWNADSYDFARVDFVVWPGFSSDSITFYPMLRHADSKDEKFQPMTRKLDELPEGQKNSNYLSYMEIDINEHDLSVIDEEDWRILKNSIKCFPNICWVTVNFGNGKGIQLLPRENSEKCGKIDSFGRIIDGE